MSERRYRALLIGNSTYPADEARRLPKLTGPPNDIRMLREALIDPDVGLHRAADVVTVEDGLKAQVEMAVATFFLNARPTDQLLFYYSGHGLPSSQWGLYLCVHDTDSDLLPATAVSKQFLETVIHTSPADATIIVLDCCYSGNVTFKGADEFAGEGRYVITSARPGHVAVDASEPDRPSPFTDLVVQGLRFPGIDTDGDGLVSMNELFHYVCNEAKERHLPIPQRNLQYAVGDLAIARRPQPPPPPTTSGTGAEQHAQRRPFKFYISYRPQDADDDAHSIGRELIRRFGSDKAIFIDVHKEPGKPGENIEAAIKRSDVLVSVIGTRWVYLRKLPVGFSNPDSEEVVGQWHRDDFIRLELRLAFESNVPLVPVLLGRTGMPTVSELPIEGDLNELLDWNEFPLVAIEDGTDKHHNSIEYICDIVEKLALKRRDQVLVSQVKGMIESARAEVRARKARARATLEKARAKAGEISDVELLTPEDRESLDELESAVAALERDLGVTALEERDRELASGVRELAATARELMEDGETGEARKALASAEEAAQSIDDDELQKDALLDVIEVEPEVTAREGRIGELLGRVRRQLPAGQIEEARATLASVEEAAREIEAVKAGEDALSEVAKLASELRTWEGAAARGDFSAAQALLGSRGSTGRANTEATKEPGEPDHAGDAGGKSVWYRWSAPDTGTATIDTSGSDFDTLLAVYRGSSLETLELVAANDDADGWQSRVRFPVTEGDEYRIAVDGYSGERGAIVLNWEVQGPPSNNDFSAAEEITGLTGTSRGDNTAATKEPGEPDHAGNAGGRSVWYRWSAPETGTATIDTFGSEFDTLLAVYRGSSLEALELVAANDDAGSPQSRVSFAVTEYGEYMIAVDGYGGAGGAIMLNWEVHETAPLVDVVRVTGLHFSESEDGALTLRFRGENAEQVVVNAKQSDDGVALFYVELPEFTGFGMRTFLKLLLKTSYRADYIKAVHLSGDQYAFAVEVPALALSPPVCEGLIRSLVALGDVENPADLMNLRSWNRRLENSQRLQDHHITVDEQRAKAALSMQLVGAATLSPHVSRRVISLIVTMVGVKPRGNKDKLRGLLDLNRGVDVAKVGLDRNGNVTLLYEVPQVFPDLVETAKSELASLSAQVRSLGRLADSV